MNDRATQFSDCRKYRYTLWREWGTGTDLFDASDYLMVIGLNPSTADETRDDPTIRRCVGFAKKWGYGALCMTNLFAWRDTLPEKMKRAPDPIGDQNNRWLMDIAGGAGRILGAWGKHGSFLGRGDKVRKLLSEHQILCLQKNADGSPKHPLYVAASVEPILL